MINEHRIKGGWKKGNWVSGSKRPIRNGVYQRRYSDGLWYCYFDIVTKTWLAPCKRVNSADKQVEESHLQHLSWRGRKKS